MEGKSQPSDCFASGCVHRALNWPHLQSFGVLEGVWPRSWQRTGIYAFACLCLWDYSCVCVLPSRLSLWPCVDQCVFLVKKIISHFLHKLFQVKGHPELSSLHPFSIKQYYHSLVPKLVPGEAFPRFFVKRNVTDSPNDEKKNSSCLFPKWGRAPAAHPLCILSLAGQGGGQVGRGAEEASLGLCPFPSPLNQLCDYASHCSNLSSLFQK